MPNVVRAPGFPIPNTEWDLVELAQIRSDLGGHSDSTALYLRATNIVGIETASTAIQENVTLEVGEEYELRLWSKGDSAGETSVRVEVTTDIDHFVFELAAPFGSGWWPWEAGAFVPTHGTATITITSIPPPTGGGGFWLLDDIEIETGMATKRRIVREALAERIRTITTGNGYVMTVGEVVEGPVRSPDEVSAWPHVQVHFGEESKETHTIGQSRRGFLTFLLAVVCRADGNVDPEDQCDDLCGEIEKAIGDYANGQWLGIGAAWPQGVFVTDINPEDLPPEYARDTRMWSMTVEVRYHHARRDP